MSSNKTIKLLGAVFLIASAAVAGSGRAQAESGWFWYDSVFAYPAVSPPVQPQAGLRSAPTRRARPLQVSAVAAPVQSTPDCFWCNRRVYISGLSF